MAGISLLVAWRAPKTRIWTACLLIGLAISAMGAILFELVYPPCYSLAFLRFDNCFELYFWEEAAEFLGIWLVLLAMLGFFSELPVSPSRRMQRLPLAMPGLALLFLLVNALLPSLELALIARPAAATMENGLRFRGYRLNERADEGWIAARLYFSARQEDYKWLGFSLHLVDQITGRSVASQNAWFDRQHSLWILGAGFEQVYRQMMTLSIPPETAPNRAYWLLLSLWRPNTEGYVDQAVLASDHRVIGKSQVALGELVLPSKASQAQAAAPALADFDIGFTLESAHLPEQVQAGETLNMRFSWRASQDGHEDHAQFLHFGHEESGAWWVHDQSPLGDRLPTRLWYSGLAESELWQLPLPRDLVPGVYAVYSGLYRHRDKERIIARDADGKAFLDARVPLGQILVKGAS